jgi:hypothetical protein
MISGFHISDGPFKGRLHNILSLLFLPGPDKAPIPILVLPPQFPHCFSGKLLLALASTIIIGSESRGTRDHILLSDDSSIAFQNNYIYTGTRQRTHFDPEDGGSIYVRNVGNIANIYTV